MYRCKIKYILFKNLFNPNEILFQNNVQYIIIIIATHTNRSSPLQIFGRLQHRTGVRQVPVVLHLMLLKELARHFLHRKRFEFHFAKVPSLTGALPHEHTRIGHRIAVGILHNILAPLDALQHEALVLFLLLRSALDDHDAAVAEQCHDAGHQ